MNKLSFEVNQYVMFNFEAIFLHGAPMGKFVIRELRQFGDEMDYALLKPYAMFGDKRVDRAHPDLLEPIPVQAVV